jgi:hypothetical protein
MWLLVLAVVATLGVVVAQAQGLGTLAGEVVDRAGKPVVGARVYMQTADGRSPKTELTNQRGQFFFPQLPKGLYHVRAQMGDRASAWARNLEVKTGKQTDVKLVLKPKPKPTPPPKLSS